MSDESRATNDLAVATLAAAIVRVRGKAEPAAVLQALKDARAAIEQAEQERFSTPSFWSL